MKNKNILMATYTLCIYAIVLFVMLTSCKSQSQKNAEAKEKQYESVRSIYVVDIEGDTVKITGGATCHLYKRIK